MSVYLYLNLHPNFLSVTEPMSLRSAGNRGTEVRRTSTKTRPRTQPPTTDWTWGEKVPQGTMRVHETSMFWRTRSSPSEKTNRSREWKIPLRKIPSDRCSLTRSGVPPSAGPPWKGGRFPHTRRMYSFLTPSRKFRRIPLSKRMLPTTRTHNAGNSRNWRGRKRRRRRHWQPIARLLERWPTIITSPFHSPFERRPGLNNWGFDRPLWPPLASSLKLSVITPSSARRNRRTGIRSTRIVEGRMRLLWDVNDVDYVINYILLCCCCHWSVIGWIDNHSASIMKMTWNNYSA